MSKNVVIFSQAWGDNSLGRAHVLWSACRQLGFKTSVYCPSVEPLWKPLRGSPFELSAVRDDSALRRLMSSTDVLLAVKPLPASFGKALDYSMRYQIPLLLDIDDPDLDARLEVGRPVRALAKNVLRGREQREYRRMERMQWSYPRIFSNPPLAQRFGGGKIVPHARADFGEGEPHQSYSPTVVFVGTNRPHKGLPLLRASIRQLQPFGYTLVVTDAAPSDAAPWEQWTGEVSLEQGQSLVKRADIVVIPSSGRSAFAQYQLPAKLMDAMLAGRAVVVADLPPLLWAVGDTAVSFEADSVFGLTAALRSLAEPGVRKSLGDAARGRALDVFSMSHVAPILGSAIDDAISLYARDPSA